MGVEELKNKNKKSYKSKIKNYLQSLSKWAKVHFRYLLCGFCSILLIVGISTSGCSTSASAYSVDIYDKVLMLPSASCKTQAVASAYSSPIFLGLEPNGEPTFGDGNSLYIVYIDNRSPVPFAPRYELIFDSSSSSSQSIYRARNVKLGGYYTGTTQTTGLALYNVVDNVAQSSLTLYVPHNSTASEEYGISPDSTITDILTVLYDWSYYIRVNTSEGSISWSLLDSNAYEMATFVYSADAIQRSSSITAVPVMSVSWFSSEEAFERGYNKGHYEGSSEGYELGFDNGYESGVNVNLNLNPIRPFAEGIQTLVNRDIFGHFSLGDLIGLAFGLTLFGFCIKIFLGG